MEPTAFVLGAQHKQWSRKNKPGSHNWKKGRGRLDLNQLVGNWDVKLHLTNSYLMYNFLFASLQVTILKGK
ncbi:hypothetical protein HOLleu_21223 [Holothuria leucospilota]|uniref:Uncharacterized protein n=1 Tax=Holothuria leucospilota TaxID=206669 RepID=A0A9Q1BX86_HOLLE|nr:hypothetical protein HOLleu_21223 [Holothuria leucospilota]